MRIVHGQDVIDYVAGRVNVSFSPPWQSLGVEHDGFIIAGAVFNCFTGPDIQVTLAAERGGFSRAFLRAIYLYITAQLGCIRCTIETEQPMIVELAKRCGARSEGHKKNLYGPGRHGFVLGIQKADWLIR